MFELPSYSTPKKSAPPMPGRVPHYPYESPTELRKLASFVEKNDLSCDQAEEAGVNLTLLDSTLSQICQQLPPPVKMPLHQIPGLNLRQDLPVVFNHQSSMYNPLLQPSFQSTYRGRSLYGNYNLPPAYPAPFPGIHPYHHPPIHFHAYGPLQYYYGPPAYPKYHTPAPRKLQIPSPVLVERKVKSISSNGSKLNRAEQARPSASCLDALA